MAYFRSTPGRPGFSSQNAASARPASMVPDVAPSSLVPMGRPLPMRMNVPHPAPAITGDYQEELWHACAGPLVSVPQQGERVWYFPQGHMEQVRVTRQGSHVRPWKGELWGSLSQVVPVLPLATLQVAASTLQGTDQQMPQYDLDSRIRCRVIQLTLSADPENDEVYAQLSLLPDSEGCESSNDKEALPPRQPKRSVRLFTKILTASDTSTHGGFSVLRKHAEECLPPLDMTQEPPCQELVARDLHGHEWRFRHTYRGHPRRHLLTTGWSYFVSQKKLAAGDAVIFLRGENGELRVGIRKLKRQQATQPPSVLSSHSMHMGVVATASHAVMTRTIFSVFYKPRMSPSAFIVPVEKLAKAKALDASIGMRFKMRFETEEASEKSYTGTIIGIEDMDAAWPNSMWRSLKVNWDEVTGNERHHRVSPWEIEQCVSSPPANSTPLPRSKRFRPSSVSELPMLGISKVALESTSSSQLPRALQGQELWTIGGGSPVSDTATKTHLWSAKAEDLVMPDGHGRLNAAAAAAESWITHGQADARRPEMFRGMISPQNNLETHQQLRLCMKQQDGCGSGSPGVQLSSPRKGFYSPFRSSEAELKLSMVHSHVQVSNSQIRGSSWQTSCHANPGTTDIPSPWLMPLISPTSQPDINGSSHGAARSDRSVNTTPSNLPHQRTVNYSPIPQLSHWEPSINEKDTTVPIAESGCKIFGFSLTDMPPPSTGVKLAKGLSSVAEEEHANIEAAPQLNTVAGDTEMGQPLKPCKSDVSCEQEKPEVKLSKDVDSRSQATQAAVRSCTKVVKTGSIVGRGVDLSKFDSYERLLEELEGMFHIEGELRNSDKGWQVAYSDNEGDMMLVGDDPWTEFCSMVRKIHIFSPEEVQTAGLPEIRLQVCADNEPNVREGSRYTDHHDSTLPALP